MPRATTVVARATPTPSATKPRREAAARDAALPTAGDLAARIVWLVTAVAWVFMAASLVSFNVADAPSHVVWPHNERTQNWCGVTGAWASYHALRFVGASIWVLMLGVGVALAMPMAGKRVGHLAVRLVGVVMMVASAAAGLAILNPRGGAIPDLAGGTLGAVVSGELLARFGVVGGVLWSLLGLGIGAVVALDRWLVTIPKWVIERSTPTATRVTKKAAEVTVAVAGAGAGAAARGSKWAIVSAWNGLVARLKSWRGRTRIRPDDVSDDPPTAAGVALHAKGLGGSRGRGRRRIAGPEIAPIDESAGGIGGVEAFDPDATQNGEGAEETEEGVGEVRSGLTGKPVRSKRGKRRGVTTTDGADDAIADSADLDDTEAQPTGVADQGAEGAEEEEEDDVPGAPQVYDEAALREKIAKLPVRFAAADRRAATEDDLRDVQNATEMEGYRFPGLDLLEEPEKNFSARLESLVREQAQALEAALNQYKISGEVTDIESGPVITLYHVRMAPGTKVAQLSAVASDIARALKAVNIRIVPNIPGRDTVGVEVPNPTKERVRLKELMSNTDRFSQMKLPMFLGKDASGEPLIGDLTTMPHMLIAGTTGSGKSVCMNTIIMSFLYTRKPSELKLVLVDPKMVEMSQFKDIPHLMCPVVTEMAKAAAILEWAVRKMDERYELLAEAGCRDIAAYNEMTWEELRDAFKPATQREEALIPRKLPYMVFIIDELADLMMTNKEVEGAIIRIAQKARAVGIHLILATQRPQANVVTGLIKSNMPCRIAFKVASGMDSRIVLDQKGGELLLGQGDMLFLSPRTSKLSRAQGTLVDDKEIRRVVRFMRDVATPTFERQLVQLRSGDEDEQRIVESKNNSSASLAAAQEDPMFDRAVEIVLESKRGSVSLLQRRLAIGYTRASRLIDLMGIAGIIGEHKGSVAREVVITLDDWEAMKRLANEEAHRLGINRTLFGPGSGEGALDHAGPDGAGTDLDEPMDLREPPAQDTGDADLDMSLGGGGMRADGAGPIIGGRPKGESDAIDLSDDDDDPDPPTPTMGRPPAPPRSDLATPPDNAPPFDPDESDDGPASGPTRAHRPRATRTTPIADTPVASEPPEDETEQAEGAEEADEVEVGQAVTAAAASDEDVSAETDNEEMEASEDAHGDSDSDSEADEDTSDEDDAEEDDPDNADEIDEERDYEYEYEYVEVDVDEDGNEIIAEDDDGSDEESEHDEEPADETDQDPQSNTPPPEVNVRPRQDTDPARNQAGRRKAG